MGRIANKLPFIQANLGFTGDLNPLSSKFDNVSLARVEKSLAQAGSSLRVLGSSENDHNTLSL